MTWVYIPAVIVLLMYGLAWFVLGVAAEAGGDDMLSGVLIWALNSALFGWIAYHAIVEVHA